MARLRDTFANRKWLVSIARDRNPGICALDSSRLYPLGDMLNYLVGAAGMAIFLDAQGAKFTVRCVPSAGQHHDPPNLPAASYLAESLTCGIGAAWRDYQDMLSGWSFVGIQGSENIRGIDCF